MRMILHFLALVFMLSTLSAAEKDSRAFELRTYYAAPGKLDELHARFRNHTMKLFEKHGISNVGYWVPTDNPDNKLVYLLAYPSREEREKSWKGFMDDPDWKAAYKASEEKGKLVSKIETIFLSATDYSPAIHVSAGSEARAFELRTYKASPGKLDNLHARFRDHTVALFTKHGMSQFGYWVPSDKKSGAEDTLIYLLTHKSREAAAQSFKAFRDDPDWIKAKADSEKDGSLTVPDGVKSVFLSPTDYSPTK